MHCNNETKLVRRSGDHKVATFSSAMRIWSNPGQLFFMFFRACEIEITLMGSRTTMDFFHGGSIFGHKISKRRFSAFMIGINLFPNV